MLSFWEKQCLQQYDFVVVGAGIMGCSMAYELRAKFPKANILVIERGTFPTGASTKNAGFLCFGSPTEILSDLKLVGANKVYDLIAQRYEGIKILLQRFNAQENDILQYGGYELILNDKLPIDVLADLNNWLQPIFNATIFNEENEKIKSFGFHNVAQLIAIQNEAQIDSGKLMQHYWKLLTALNVQIITGIEVQNIQGNEIIAKNLYNGNFSLKAANIVLCTNAFISELLPEMPVKPGRGQVLITKPIPNLLFKGNFHINEGFEYFRNVGNRVLFGGARNLDIATEQTTQFEPNALILQHLKNRLKDTILPNQDFKIEQEWQGIMGFSDTKEPIIMQLNKHTLYVMACNGMGVALSPLVAKLAVQKY